MIDRGELVAVSACLGHMLFLGRGERSVLLPGEPFLCSVWARVDAAMATVIADVGGVHDDCLLIDVPDDVDVHIVHAGVIEKVAASPVTASVAGADVTETVVNSAVEADLRTPISSIPKVGAVGPTPVAGRPEQTRCGRFDPCAGHPKITAVVAVAPITRRPDIAFTRANRLRVNGQSGWRDCHRENHLS